MYETQIFTREDIQQSMYLERISYQATILHREILNLRYGLQNIDTDRVNIAPSFLTRMDVHLSDMEMDLSNIRDVMENRKARMVNRRPSEDVPEPHKRLEIVGDDSDD